jgi:hypothetical protein
LLENWLYNWSTRLILYIYIFYLSTFSSLLALTKSNIRSNFGSLKEPTLALGAAPARRRAALCEDLDSIVGS